MQELLNLNKEIEWILKSESNILNCCSSLQCSLDDTSICLQISWSFEIRKYNTLVIIGVSLAWMIWPISVASFSSLLVCGTQVSITASVTEQYVGMANGDALCCYPPFILSSIISFIFLFLFWIFSHMPACCWTEFLCGHPPDMCHLRTELLFCRLLPALLGLYSTKLSSSNFKLEDNKNH